MTISKVDWLSIRTAHEEATAAQAAAEHAKSARTSAKDAVEDERESIDQMQTELIEKYGDKLPGGEDGQRLMKQCRAVREALDRFEMADRRARQANHHFGEMTERFFQIVGEIATNEGSLPFDAKDTARNGPDAWKRVELKNLMGDLQALPFEKVGIRTVGEAELAIREKTLGPRVSAGEFSAEQADYLRFKVIDLLNRFAIEHQLGGLDPSVSEKFTIAPPEVQKAAKTAAAVEDGGGEGGEEEAGDESQPEAKPRRGKNAKPEIPGGYTVAQWTKDDPPQVAQIVLHHRKDFKTDPAYLTLTSSWLSLYRDDQPDGNRPAWREIITKAMGDMPGHDETMMGVQKLLTGREFPTVGTFVDRMERIFDQKNPRDVLSDLDELPHLVRDIISTVLETEMHYSGSPALYTLVDRIVARHVDVVQELFPRLVRFAERPAEERYGRSDQPNRVKQAETPKKAKASRGKKSAKESAASN
ncbi:hypothetical protein [Tolypothrix sp. VBCCA 56010]|uniref:hypothetical protein n=1 Tax=Tolypothrix sp. VBCCA 56010 TaxID=3137731 RepID=UPI003D7D997D